MDPERRILYANTLNAHRAFRRGNYRATLEYLNCAIGAAGRLDDNSCMEDLFELRRAAATRFVLELACKAHCPDLSYDLRLIRPHVPPTPQLAELERRLQ